MLPRIVLLASMCTLASSVTVPSSALSEPVTTQAAASLTASPANVEPAIGTIVPAGAHIRFHLDAPLSSSESKTGQHFTFTLIDPIAVGTTRIAVSGARGHGTVLLAGHAGTSGHEGDLTLRVDYLDTLDRNELGFNDARFEVNGKNHKIASGVLGLVPYAGLGARYIRGREIVVGTDVPVLFVTTRPATVMSEKDAEFLTFPVPTLPSAAPTIAPAPVATDTPSR